DWVDPVNCLPEVDRKILAAPGSQSPDNCCAGCCGHNRDRDTGPNAEPAVEDWIGANERDLAARILRRQTNLVHELVKCCRNVQLVGGSVFRTNSVFSHHQSSYCSSRLEAHSQHRPPPDGFIAALVRKARAEPLRPPAWKPD